MHAVREKTRGLDPTIKLSREFEVACVIHTQHDLMPHSATFENIHGALLEYDELELSSVIDTLFDWDMLRAEQKDGVWRYRVRDENVPLIRELIQISEGYGR